MIRKAAKQAIDGALAAVAYSQGDVPAVALEPEPRYNPSMAQLAVKTWKMLRKGSKAWTSSTTTADRNERVPSKCGTQHACMYLHACLPIWTHVLRQGECEAPDVGLGPARKNANQSSQLCIQASPASTATPPTGRNASGSAASWLRHVSRTLQFLRDLLTESAKLQIYLAAAQDFRPPSASPPLAASSGPR